MGKLKNLFKTSKRTVIVIIVAFIILIVLGTCFVYATSAIAESSSIGGENAKNFACADAGVDPTLIQLVSTEFDFEDGQFVYEVKFIVNGVEYEYVIKASDGTVLKKEIEGLTNTSNATESVDTTASETTSTNSSTSISSETPQNSGSSSSTSQSSSSNTISIDKAKSIATEKFGFNTSEVTFKKAKLEYDDGMSVYEIEFYKDGMEYEVTINAKTGSIIEYDCEIND